MYSKNRNSAGREVVRQKRKKHFFLHLTTENLKWKVEVKCCLPCFVPDVVWRINPTIRGMQTSFASFSFQFAFWNLFGLYVMFHITFKNSFSYENACEFMNLCLKAKKTFVWWEKSLFILISFSTFICCDSSWTSLKSIDPNVNVIIRKEKCHLKNSSPPLSLSPRKPYQKFYQKIDLKIWRIFFFCSFKG